VHGLHAATSKVVNSAQGSSCKLKFVHEHTHTQSRKCGHALNIPHSISAWISRSPVSQREREGEKEREGGRERERESKREGEKEGERERCRIWLLYFYF
jgi:hypothetical protein